MKWTWLWLWAWWFSVAGCPGIGGPQDGGRDGGEDGDGAGPDGADPGPPPLLESVEPAEGPAGGGTEVVLRGAGFAPGASVRFGAVVADSPRVVSLSRIDALTPPGSPGPVTVRVTNPDSRFGSLEGGFVYLAPLQDCPRETGCEPAEAVFRYGTGNPADTVQLAGDFTGWRDGAIPMLGDAAGNFETRVQLQEGRYEYKFLVNGTDWRADPAAGEPEPFFGNSVRLHDNPCTPNLVDRLPAYGEVLRDAWVTVSAAYQDAEAGAGIDPASVCLVVDGIARAAAWDQGSGRIRAELGRLEEGDHQWWMSAGDRGGHRSAEVSGWFSVNVAGEAPVADAGPTQFVDLGSLAVLDATWSRDPDGIAVTSYRWNQTQGTAVSLTAQHVTPHAGYDNQPAAEPPRTEALMGFLPPAVGVYRFELTVEDEDGSSAPALAEVMVLNPGGGARPLARISVANQPSQVTADASASTGTEFRWIPDVRNPASVPLPGASGSRLTLAAGDLPKDGTYFFYLVVAGLGVDSLPATVMVKKQGAAVAGYDFNAPPDWLPDAQIYEVYVRAFADGNGDGRGDLPGLLQKLDYLEGLGVNTLWLMPVFESADHAHGYHTLNYLRVERDYGNNQDLAALIRSAHQRGMRVVLDLVINHTSRHHPRFLAALDPQSRFHDHYIWFVNHPPTDPLLSRYGFGRELGGNRLTVEAGWGDIPDVNFANPVCRDWLFGVARTWMDPNRDGDFADGVDGFRLDHVTGPAHRVWRNLRYELKSIRPEVLLLAEVFRDFDNGGQGYGIKDYYRGEFDLAFTFPFYWVAQGVFKNGEPVGGCGAPCGLDWLMGAIAERFEQGEVMCFFIENHDVPWYTTVYADWGRVEGKLVAANTLMQTLPNSPQLLYGQELGTDSWRGAMPWAKDTPANPLQTAYRRLMHLRRDHPALRRGGYTRLVVGGALVQDVFAFARTTALELLVVVVNVRGAEAAGVTVDLSPLGTDAARLRDLVDGREWTVSGGSLTPRRLGAYEVWVGVLEGP